MVLSVAAAYRPLAEVEVERKRHEALYLAPRFAGKPLHVDREHSGQTVDAYSLGVRLKRGTLSSAHRSPFRALQTRRGTFRESWSDPDRPRSTGGARRHRRCNSRSTAMHPAFWAGSDWTSRAAAAPPARRARCAGRDDSLERQK